jgi:hypothetical protein
MKEKERELKWEKWTSPTLQRREREIMTLFTFLD